MVWVRLLKWIADGITEAAQMARMATPFNLIAWPELRAGVFDRIPEVNELRRLAAIHPPSPVELAARETTEERLTRIRLRLAEGRRWLAAGTLLVRITTPDGVELIPRGKSIRFDTSIGGIALLEERNMPR
jgi:hypothetical protein